MIHTMLGCPIRKSTDQSFLTTPRSLSQSSTSFFASVTLGIHHLPLKFLFILRYYLIKCTFTFYIAYNIKINLHLTSVVMCH